MPLYQWKIKKKEFVKKEIIDEKILETSRKKFRIQIKYPKYKKDWNKNIFWIKEQHFYTVVGDYINTMKTTLDLNFDLNQAEQR